MQDGNTVVNALVGAVVGMVSGLLLGPLSPILGGWVAGYLEGGDRSAGLWVGAYVGAVMLAVGAVAGFLLLTVLAGGVSGVSGFTGVFPSGRVAVWFVVILLVGGAATVGFGAIGGFIGALVKAETADGN